MIIINTSKERKKRLQYLLEMIERLGLEDPETIFTVVVKKAKRKWFVTDRTAKEYGKDVLLQLGGE